MHVCRCARARARTASRVSEYPCGSKVWDPSRWIRWSREPRGGLGSLGGRQFRDKRKKNRIGSLAGNSFSSRQEPRYIRVNKGNRETHPGVRGEDGLSGSLLSAMQDAPLASYGSTRIRDTYDLSLSLGKSAVNRVLSHESSGSFFSSAPPEASGRPCRRRRASNGNAFYHASSH